MAFQCRLMEHDESWDVLHAGDKYSRACLISCQEMQEQPCTATAQLSTLHSLHRALCQIWAGFAIAVSPWALPHVTCDTAFSVAEPCIRPLLCMVLNMLLEQLMWHIALQGQNHSDKFDVPHVNSQKTSPPRLCFAGSKRGHRLFSSGHLARPMERLLRRGCFKGGQAQDSAHPIGGE